MDWRKVKVVFTDFDGVLTDNRVLTSQSGEEFLYANKSDGIAIKDLKKHGIEVIIISSDLNSTVLKRAEKIKTKAFNGVENKGELIEELLVSLKLDKSNSLFIGNDINDLEAYNSVGIFCSTLDAFYSVRLHSDYVVPVKGGDGVLRELSQIINYKQL